MITLNNFVSMQNSQNNYNEYLIIKCLRESDEAAFEFLFKEYYKPLCLYLGYFIKIKDVVEQIVQEVFVNIWENRKSFSPKGNIKSYLYRAVKNKGLNYLKHEKIKIKSREDLKAVYYSEETNIEKQFESDELLKLIEECVEQLPEKCREIFILVKFNGISYNETSEILNLSAKTVENQMGKALKKLRELLLPSIK